jgi:hypothetical protein
MEKWRESASLNSNVDMEDTTLLTGIALPQPKVRRHCRSLSDRAIGFMFGVLAAMALFLTLYHFSLSNHQRHLPRMIEGTDEHTGKPASWFNGDCGNSANEARTRGCRFDRILHAWLPPACTRQEDIREEQDFLTVDNWKYYRDPQQTEELTLEEAYRGELEVLYTSWRWHLVHCTYVWKKLHRALLDGKNIDSYSANINHTAHCSEAILLDSANESLSTRIFTKFPTCG